MNILPKKKWHVRTKENMARVRRDEAKAAEEQRRIDDRAAQAEHEDRVRRLQKKASEREASMFDMVPSGPSTSTSIDASGHVNFFTELEQKETRNTTVGNKELEKEKKKEQDEWEQKVGILTYLGGNTNELTKQKSWYERPFQRDYQKKEDKKETKPEVEIIPVEKKKEKGDRKEKKKKRHRSRSPDSDDRSRKHKKSKRKRRHRSPSTESESEEEKKKRLQKLREERLRREQEERSRTQALLNPAPIKKEPEQKPAVQQRYSSQFNPQFARQNLPRDRH
ncbi:hypothetical protein QR680_008552 [Steinernema hermaphroditum]|uniref:CBF1-interacting co-repressor CIR N-terminal domain-containing protein n=1 Tax=Steinernema hermaphroditum TaxID=289476 RepID=A0AA39M780_9BILA|nr:hypothetical protein QR680_008552 [Steinernema hermaphroditum]